MGFKMGFSQEDLKGPEPVPAGIYDVVFAGFKPKKSKDGNSINLNGTLKIIGHPEYDNRVVFCNLNDQVPGFIQDFVHMFGIEMDDQDGANPSLPGTFEDWDIKDLSKAKYVGPLTSQTGKVEVAMGSYDGKPKNDIVKFICKVDNCDQLHPNIRHARDMRKKA